MISMNLQEQAHDLLIKGKYKQSTCLYEQAIETAPEVVTNYWYLGLAYLLQEQEEAAQTTWLLAMAQGSDEETEQWTEELVQILNTEAHRQVELENFQLSWLIRQHIREIAPTYINNLLQLIEVSINLGNFAPEYISDWQVAVFLQQASPKELDLNLLIQVLRKLLEFPSPETLFFTEACLSYYTHNPRVFIENVMPITVKLAHQIKRPDFAVNLAELCLKLNSEHPEALRHLSCFYTQIGYHQQAIETAKHFFRNCSTLR